MNLKKNIKVGLTSIVFLFTSISLGYSNTNLEGNYTEIKILNKISNSPKLKLMSKINTYGMIFEKKFYF